MGCNLTTTVVTVPNACFTIEPTGIDEKYKFKRGILNLKPLNHASSRQQTKS
jgi:hypothetical protein